MFEQLFLSHPRSIGESYFEHQRTAMGFALALWAAGLACMIHALVPGLYEFKASGMVARLHQRMVQQRASRAAPLPSAGPRATAA